MAAVMVEKEACCKVEDVDENLVGSWADRWMLLLVAALKMIILVMM